MSIAIATDIRTALLAVPALEGRIALDHHILDDTPYPNVAQIPDVSAVPGLRGDQRTMARLRTCQVNLFQAAEDEDDDLFEAVVAALDGLALTRPLLRLTYQDHQRISDFDPGVVQHAITFTASTLI